MSADTTAPPRRALPLVCGRFDARHPLRPGYFPAICSRCRRAINVYKLLDKSIRDCGIVRELVCTRCWSYHDQITIRSYRGICK